MDWAAFVSKLVLALVPIGRVSFIRDGTRAGGALRPRQPFPEASVSPGQSGHRTECRPRESSQPVTGGSKTPTTPIRALLQAFTLVILT